ncbi:hypothetical protein Ddye_031464 [Dipteronia dyeriana]|uniref:Vinorine synthase-like n=1 Tax=Dipteronia dyeriana TaxID=168575 RepID=A0AAD9TJ02_9ROSI|nr:hypothetical protein Ddye_031464 [Dipteronia dyeriana]
MKLEVEVISKETIKPSSPTPEHLYHYHLSFLDQISPPVYSPLVLFYPTHQNNQEIAIDNVQITTQLKTSLSEVLTCFYPLAGRIKDNTLIVCGSGGDNDDGGIPFTEATVNCALSDVIQNPVPAELNKLLPFPELDDGADEIPFGVQFNNFNCGGIGIGVCLSHKIGDALSLFTFLKNWAATSRGDRDSVQTEFVSASLFPPRNLSGFKPTTGVTKENIITKRFVFSASKIEEFRAKYTDQSFKNLKRPSRVEALSAFLWSRFMASKKKEVLPGVADRVYMVLHAVNLRPRFEPPLPEYSFGNLYRIAVTVPSTEDDDDDQEQAAYRLIAQMRESISSVDKEYVKKLQEQSELHLDFLNDMVERFNRGEMVSFNITSLCRFPLYESDFGWGKPVWVGSVSLTFSNVVTFFDTVSGNGIEAWMNMKKEDMARLEVDEELILATTA